MHVLTASATGREKKCMHTHLQSSAFVCVCVFSVLVFHAVIREGNMLPCSWMSKRTHVRKHLRAATSARGGESGAEGDHNRGRGSALTDQGCRHTSSNRKSRAGLVRGTRVSHSPRWPKSCHSDKAGGGLARRASQWVRSSEGCGWAQNKLQHSSRDKMWRLSLNVPPRKEVECLQQGFFTPLTWQSPNPRLLCHSRTSLGHGKPIPIPEVCAEGHCALVPGNTKTRGKNCELFY